MVFEQFEVIETDRLAPDIREVKDLVEIRGDVSETPNLGGILLKVY